MRIEIGLEVGMGQRMGMWMRMDGEWEQERS
jgi:hypothetical protein